MKRTMELAPLIVIGIALCTASGFVALKLNQRSDGVDPSRLARFEASVAHSRS